MVSFGGIGNSRLLKAMKISYKLYCNSDLWCKFTTENKLKVTEYHIMIVLAMDNSIKWILPESVWILSILISKCTTNGGRILDYHPH